MIPRYATVLAILAQVLATLAPRSIFYCVHDDGSSAIEFAGALCCQSDDSEVALGPSTDPHESEPRITGADDPCTDYALTIEQVRPTTAQQSPSDSGVVPATPALAPHDVPAWCWARKKSVLPKQCGPPGNRPPRFETVVLLC